MEMEKKTYTDNFQSPAIWSDHDNTWTYKYDSETGERTGDKSTEVPWSKNMEVK